MPLRNNLWNRIGALANAARKMRANFEGNGFFTAELDGILRDLSASEVGEGTITAALTKIKKLQAAVSGSGVLTADLGGFDPNAQAFIDAAGITGETQQNALNQLVLDLKGEGSTTNNTNVFSKGVACYPICPISSVSATLTGFSYNLINTAAFQVTWQNAPTAAQNGITGNGTNQYGETGIIVNSELTQNNTSLTASSSNGASATVFAISGRNSVNQALGLASTSAGNDLTSIMYGNTGRLDASVGTTGVQTGTRSAANDHKIYLNGSQVATQATSSGTFPTVELFLMCLNDNGSPNFFDDRTFNFFFIGEALTANEAKDLYDAIITYNTSLGR